MFVSYLVLSRNGEDSFTNKLLSPDRDPGPDHLTGRLSHWYRTSFVKQIKPIWAIVFLLRQRIDKQTDPGITLPSHSSLRVMVTIMGGSIFLEFNRYVDKHFSRCLRRKEAGQVVGCIKSSSYLSPIAA